MVIIRINGNIPEPCAKIIEERIHTQAPTGTIVVPSCCEVLYGDKDSPEITVTQEGNRVAALEAELAAAMKYITALKDCEACKHYETVPTCPSDCAVCRHGSCTCRECYNSSKWEWRGAHGKE